MNRRAALHSLTFLALLVLPVAGWLVGVDDTAALAERRRLAEIPGVPTDGASLRAFPARFEAWWDDHFGFRSALIRSNKEIEWRVKRSQVEMVVGNDGWLFLGKPDRIARHRCVVPRPEHAAAWRAQAERRRDDLARRGVPWLWILAPNKHTIYADRLPDAGSPCDLDALAEPLAAATGNRLLDLRPILMAEQAGPPRFYKTDTHWNEVGALVGARAIVESLRARFPALPRLDPNDFEVEVEAGLRGGDIADLVRVYGEIYTEDRLTLRAKRGLRARPVEGSPPLEPTVFSRREQRLVMETGDPALPRAVLFHDSFAYPLMPALSEHFERIVYVNTTGAIDPAILDAERPDVVLVLIVEEKFLTEPSPDLAPLAVARGD